VFKNTFKEAGDNKPDYEINLAEDDDAPQQQRPARQQSRQSVPAQAPPPPPSTDEIPFAWLVPFIGLALAMGAMA
jgi:hypothetical protein